MRLGFTLTLSKKTSIDEVVDLARLADKLGYHSVWVPETWGTDAVSLMAVLCRETNALAVASGVLNVYSRSAALIAQTAATLQDLSSGRFILGLGASGPIVVENWHGVEYGSPLQRTRDYVAIIRMALAGERVNYHRGRLNLRNFRLSNPPERRVPIYIAALGPRNVRLTGEIADGWLPIFAGRGHMAGQIDALGDGASSAGRDPSSLEVAAYLPVLLGPRGRELIAQQLAYYVGSMGSFYAQYVTNMGFGAQARRVRELWEAGDHVAAVRAVQGDLLDACTLGDSAQIARDRLEAYAREGVGLPILAFPSGSAPDEIGETLRQLAPSIAS